MSRLDRARRPGRRTRLGGVLALLAPLCLGGILPSSATAATAPAPAPVTVDAAHPLTFAATTGAGEGILHLTVAAPGANWSAPVSYDPATHTRTGHAGGLLDVTVDGHYVTSLDVFSPVAASREVELGALGAGQHTVGVGLAAASLVPAVTVASPALSADADPWMAYTPVLHARNLSAYDSGDPDQNVYDDAPMLAWHEVLPGYPVATDTTYQYSVIWTNEDNGTGSPDLMGRWGRTTDIELEYSVTFDTATGAKVPGLETFQGPNHVTTVYNPSNGYADGTHPILQTCTGNNNFCDAATANEDGAAGINDDLVYRLSYRDTRVADRAREVLLDAHPWVYPVMAAEQAREGKVRAADCVPTPEATLQTDTVGSCDQRQYLYLEVVKSTSPSPSTVPYDPSGELGNLQTIGISLWVYLRDGTGPYRSDRGVLGRTAVRDVPVTEAVALPPGTTAADIARIDAVRQNSGSYPDSQATLTVHALNKGFFLGDDYRPQSSFVTAHGLAVPLTASAPIATVWTAPAAESLPEVHLPILLMLLALLILVSGYLPRRRRARQPGG